MSTKDNATDLLNELQNASKEQETNIVIELGTDRMIRWIGVYLLLTLAAVAKLSSVIGSNLSCYPILQNESSDGNLISFATIYCWESRLTGSNASSMNDACQLMNATVNRSDGNLLDDPSAVKAFMQWLPYLMLAQTFLFALPLAHWHFRAGARVVGHLKFMQLLLTEIFEKVKNIKLGTYDHTPYDKYSSMFDARRDYVSLNDEKPEEQQNASSEEMEAVVEDAGRPNENIPLCAINQKNETKIKSLSWWEEFVAGDMRDRHFFSMLCYENFASLHHLPYILSTFMLNKFVKDDGQEEPFIQRPLNETMLYLWCDKKNFNNVFLLKMYAQKHLFTALMSLLMTSAMLVWFFVVVYDDLLLSATFRCQLPYQHICLLCTIKSVRDMFLIFVLDICLTLAVLFASLWKWRDVRASCSKDCAHFFDRLMETSNVSLLAAEYSMESD